MWGEEDEPGSCQPENFCKLHSILLRAWLLAMSKSSSLKLFSLDCDQVSCFVIFFSFVAEIANPTGRKIVFDPLKESEPCAEPRRIFPSKRYCSGFSICRFWVISRTQPVFLLGIHVRSVIAKSKGRASSNTSPSLKWGLMEKWLPSDIRKFPLMPCFAKFPFVLSSTSITLDWLSGPKSKVIAFK